MRKNRSLPGSGIPFWGSKKCVCQSIINLMTDDVSNLETWNSSKAGDSKNPSIGRTNQVNPCQQSQKAGAFGSKGMGPLAPGLGGKVFFLKWPKHLDRVDLHQDIFFYEVPRPLGFRNLRNTWDAIGRCSPHLFFKLKVLSFRQLPLLGLLEGNNRTTDCLFLIIGSTVRQAMGCDKTIPARVSNSCHRLDRDTKLCLLGVAAA